MRNERILTVLACLAFLLLGGLAIYNGNLQNTYRHQVNEVSDRLSVEQAANAELRQSISGMQSQLESSAAAAALKEKEATAKIAGLAADNEQLQKSVAALQKENSGLKATQNKLKTKIETLSAKKAEAAAPKPTSKKSGGSVLSGFEVTWYNDQGKTASGRYVKHGVTASVDPSVIPLGSWIELTFPDGTVLTRRADDTGGAVNGRIVDIYASASTRELLQRGRTYGVKVRILGKD